MANTAPSSNMSLPIPVVGTQSGPQYAININDCLTILDQHTHTPGSGVPITSAALDINADLSMGGNNLTDANSIRFSSLSTTLVSPSDLGCLYEVNDDLYFNDGNGTAIRITQNGAVAGTPGSIANLASPASASYVSASSTFVFQSNVNTPAYLDGASILIRNLTASSKALTLEAPAAMGADFTLTLPNLPASKKIMTLDSSGAMAADYGVDGVSLEVASNTIRVKDGGLSTAKYADGSITAVKIASGVIKDLQNATFTSSGNWTCPVGVTQVLVEGCGGGGGGGGGGVGSGSWAEGGSAGRPGGFGVFPVTVVPGNIYAVVIGAGGGGGAAGSGGGVAGSTGGTGGDTSFNGIVFKGGLGGYGGSGTATMSTGSTSRRFSGGETGFNGAAGVGGLGGPTPSTAGGAGTGYGSSGGGGSGRDVPGAGAGGAGFQGYLNISYLAP